MKRKRLYLALIMAFTLLISARFPVEEVKAESDDRGNRFNVAVVLDASNSMNYTDPSGLRYEAVNLFTNLLAEEGNYLGGVVFANHVEASQAPELVSAQADKDKVTELLSSFMSHDVTNQVGYTNIGEGLGAAVDMLVSKGNPDLPSVIVFMSDGNTEMPTEDEQTGSLDRKAAAIQKARENKINIYSICLNANQKADVGEMNQISTATGGKFEEVLNADDLQDVFNTFYNLIYGTSTIKILDDSFPAEGRLEAVFEVPGIGVEEVNIIIYGDTSAVRLYKPNGTESDAPVTKSGTFTMIKLTDVVPGQWKLVAEGRPGDSIKINMVYNTNLEVGLASEMAKDVVNPVDAIDFAAYLRAGSIEATKDAQYTGYAGELIIKDGYGEVVESTSMEVKDGHFAAELKLEDGTYYAQAKVTGNHLEKISEPLGPITVSSEALTEEQRNNTPPTAVENPVKETITLWPFKDNSYTLDMTTLATDKQDKELRYKVESSSFIEKDDYVVNGNTLKITNYSLSKGGFTISATDSGGLSCEIEVIIVSLNVGLMTLIGLGIAIFIGLIFVGFNLWYWTRKPFRGTVSAQSFVNGTYRGNPRNKQRGRIKLSAFGMDPVGLDYNKSYIQATGEQYVLLVTDKPVIWNGEKTNRVRIQSGAEVTITIAEGDSKLLYVRFDSRIHGGAVPRRGPRRPAARR